MAHAYCIRFLAIVMLMLGWSLTARSGQDLDSLRLLLSNSSGMDRVDLLNQIGTKIGNVDPLKALEYCQLAYDESVHLKYGKGEVISLKVIGNLYAIRYQLDTALFIIRRSMEKAVDFELEDEIPSIGVALGGLYLRQYQYKNAFEVLNESLEVAKARGQKDVLTSILINMGIAREGLGQLDEAESTLQDALKISLTEDNQLRTGQVYGNLGNLEFKRGNYTLAREYQENGLLLFRALGMTQMVAISQVQLGRIFIELSQYTKSINYLDSVIAIGESQNDQRMIVSAQRHKVQALFRLREYDDVKVELESVIPKARVIADYIILGDLFDIGYRLAEINKNPERALNFYKEYTLSKDSLEARANRLEMNQLTAEFDQNQLRNLAEKEAKNAEIAQLKLSRRNLIIIGLVVVIALIVLVFVLNQNRLKHGFELAVSKQRLMERELELNTLKIANQQKEISSYQHELDKRYSEESSNEDLFKILDVAPLSAKDWGNFRLSFDKRFPGFFESLGSESLTTYDKRLACLIKLGLSTKEIATTLAITPKSVNKAKSRLTSKLLLSNVQELESSLQKLS